GGNPRTIVNASGGLEQRRPGGALVGALQHGAADAGLVTAGVDIAGYAIEGDGSARTGDSHAVPRRTTVRAFEEIAVRRRARRGGATLSENPRHVQPPAVDGIDENALNRRGVGIDLDR